MDHVEERLRRLERSRGIRALLMPMACVVPLLLLLAGVADSNRSNQNREDGIVDKLVARSLVLVDEANRPRIDLGIDSRVGAHMFMRSEDGVPMLTMTATGESGSLAILDEGGHAIAFLTASSGGQGLLRLSDSQGRTIARIGQWAGQTSPGAEYYRHSGQEDDESDSQGR